MVKMIPMHGNKSARICRITEVNTFRLLLAVGNAPKVMNAPTSKEFLKIFPFVFPN